MRSVSFGLNISIDGYCDHTIFNPDEEVLDYFTRMMDDVDLVFFGRVIYELMFPYWSDVARDQSGTEAENRFAEKFSAMDKVVVSTTLEQVEEGVRIIRSNPMEELRRLKQQPGKTISVDSISMLPDLIEGRLIDELYLVVHPVLAGEGRRLLDAGDLAEKLELKLIGNTTFKSGCVALHYRRAID